MSRRLLAGGRDSEREQQQRMMAEIEGSIEPRIRDEIRRASDIMVEQYESTRNIEGVDDHAKQVKDILLEDYAGAIEKFGRRILNAAKAKHGPDNLKVDERSFFERLIQEYLSERGLDKISDDIAGTTKQQLLNAIRAGQRAGEGQQAIGQQLRDAVPRLSSARAGVIARTETHAASNFANEEAAKETGLKLQKEWISAMGERTRTIEDGAEFDHVAADGQIRDMDEPFVIEGAGGSEQLKYPGDPNGSAANIINCRCVVAYIVQD